MISTPLQRANIGIEVSNNHVRMVSLLREVIGYLRTDQYESHARMAERIRGAVHDYQRNCIVLGEVLRSDEF